MGGSSTDAQWVSMPQLQNFPVACFLATSDSTLFVGGYYHSLYKSTDDGDTWVNTIGEIWADTITCLASSDGYIFVGTTGAGIFRSPDRGKSWAKADSGIQSGYGCDINQFACTDSGVYAATPLGVYFTSDSGNFWRPVNEGVGTFAWGGQTYIVYILGVVSTPSALFLTQDLGYGASIMFPESGRWKYIGLSAHMCDAAALAAIDTNVFAGTQDGVFMYSGKDSSWLPRSNGLPQFIPFCFFATADSLLFLHVGVAAGAIYVSGNLGESWSMVDGSIFSSSGVNAMATDKKYLFAGTQSGAWRIPLSDVVTSVHDTPPALPNKYALFQNYPNPFNPTTVISYQLSAVSKVTLIIYDVLGREVAILVNGVRQPGNYA
ncbi:MAG: hypothetical protein B7Z63_06200, partial [Ignavibacteriae bacterium 37-53-5]